MWRRVASAAASSAARCASRGAVRAGEHSDLGACAVASIAVPAIGARGFAKAKKSPAKRRGGPAPMGPAKTNPQMKAATEKHWNALLAAMTPVEIPAENLSAEELAEFEARAKAYSKKKMAQHRAWQKDITDKIRHKRAAVAALPEGYLRTAAEQEDHALFPLKRQTPMMTPPIEGFYEEKQRKAEEAVSGEGRMGGGGRR